MVPQSTLTTLIDIAEKLTDEAAAKLGAAIRQVDDLENKLNLLKKYRDDYSAKMQAELRAGRDMQHIRNFQQFMGKIDDAIQGQHQLVSDAQKRVLVEKLNWQENEKKRMSYSTLEDRAAKAQLKKENKRDQLQSDEHAARLTYFKQNESGQSR
jgi:flagellar FliJ protein